MSTRQIIHHLSETGRTLTLVVYWAVFLIRMSYIMQTKGFRGDYEINRIFELDAGRKLARLMPGFASEAGSIDPLACKLLIASYRKKSLDHCSP